MTEELLNGITINRLGKDEAPPYELLLDADPSKEVVDKYLVSSDIFIVNYNKNIIGVYVLYPLDAARIEIKNIAVSESFQRKGIGKFMLKDAFKKSKDMGYKSIIIGTSNTSMLPLYLYQKVGFEMTGILINFITEHYPEPLFENGIQCKHMIILTKTL